MHPIVHAFQGYIYPDEAELQWSILIVLYPFITGLVAGAFILASLERVFKVEAVKPIYRLALLTALALLAVVKQRPGLAGLCLGLGTVAIYTYEDRFALHRFKADESYLIGPADGGEPVKGYLNIEQIIADYVRATYGGEPPAAHLKPEKPSISVKAIA